MAVVSLSQVQAWLEQTKHTLTELDTELESAAHSIVTSTLASDYIVSGWVDEATTPKLVRQIIAMLVASWAYQRAYSEDDGNSNRYARWLEIKAYDLIKGLKDGSVDLTDVEGTTASGGVAFHPTDRTGSSEIYDANGVLVGVAGSEDIKFYMGATF